MYQLTLFLFLLKILSSGERNTVYVEKGEGIVSYLTFPAKRIYFT